MSHSEESSGSKTTMIVVAVVAAMLVTGLGTWYITKKSVSKPVVVEAPAELPAPVATPVPEPEQPAPAAPVVAASTSPRYYVVLGSFEVSRNVSNMVQNLSSKGLAPKTLPVLRNGLTPVAAADFETLTEAYNFIHGLKDYEEFWVLKQ